MSVLYKPICDVRQRFTCTNPLSCFALKTNETFLNPLVTLKFHLYKVKIHNCTTCHVIVSCWGVFAFLLTSVYESENLVQGVAKFNVTGQEGGFLPVN
jgi:hypothetical protein